MTITPGSKVFLRACRFGEPGIVIHEERGKGNGQCQQNSLS
jgi:hypothetical protein